MLRTQAHVQGMGETGRACNWNRIPNNEELVRTKCSEQV